MPDPNQAELDRLMAQATGTPPPQTTPDAQLLSMAQDAVTANQPLPSPAGVPAPVAAPAPDAVDQAVAAPQPPAPAPPVAPPVPAEVAPAASAGPAPVPPQPGAEAPVPPAPPPADKPAPVVGSHGVSFKEAGRQLDQAEQAGQRAADAEMEAGKVAGQMAADKAQSHQMIADEIRGQVIERRALETARAEGVARAQQMADEAQKKLDSFTYHDYFGTHRDENGNEVPNPGGSKTLARVFSFISGFNVGAFGAPDIAYRNITKGIEMDMQRQKAELALEQDRAKRAGEHVKDTAALFDSQLAMLDLKHANLLKATAEEAEAFAMQRGDADAQARAKVLSEKLRAEYAQKHAEGIEKLASSQASLAMAGAHLAIARENAAAARDARADKAADALDSRTVQLDDGSTLRLPTPRAVPEFTKGYNSRVQAAEKIKALEDDIRENHSVYTPDAVARRQALIHDANIAVGSISSMGASDHSAHLELGTLGPGGVRTLPWEASPDVALKLLEEKRKQIDDGTERTIATMRKDRGTEATAGGEGAPAPKATKGKPADGAPAAAPPAGGVHGRLADGRTGTIYPGGKFVPDQADIKL